MIARVAVILQSIPSQAAAAEHQQFSNFKDREASLAVKNQNKNSQNQVGNPLTMSKDIDIVNGFSKAFESSS